MTEKVKELQKRISMDLRINDANLSMELKEQPSKFAYWGAAHAIKLQEYNMAKVSFQEKESVLAAELEKIYTAMKKKDSSVRTTDKIIKDAVVRHPERSASYKELIDVGLEEGILSVAKEAFRQRSQMVLELARDRRNDLTTPESVYTRQLVKEYRKDED